MLLRRKSPLFSGKFLDPRPGEGAPADDAPAESERRVLPRSRIYERGATREDTVSSVAESVLKLRRFLGDRKFHNVSDLAASMGTVEVVAAAAELVRLGISFDVSGRHLRMRARRVGEPPQSLLEVFDGLLSHTITPHNEAEQAIGEEGSAGDFDPSADAGETSPTESDDQVSDGLVLSDPPEALTLPLSMVSSMASAILAKRGSGKSYLGMVLVEELLAAPNPPALVVFDPTGVWWGLLATQGGAPAAREIVLLGGPRGHLPLLPGAGSKVAEIVANRPDVPVILDMSEMAPAEQHEVCAGFCEKLLGMPKFSVHVVFDEADEFAPQRLGHVGGHQKRALGFVERLVMRGRTRMIGVTLISLRPAVLSKNVLSQVDALYLLRMVEPNDLRAVSSWLENFERNISSEQRSQCLGNMPVLPVGTSYFLRGGEEVIFRRFKVRRKRSFDSSRTPDGGSIPDPSLRRPAPEILGVVRKIISGGGVT